MEPARRGHRLQGAALGTAVKKTRVPQVKPGTKPELSALEARIRGARGRISPLYAVLLNSPELASGWEQLFTAIRQKTSVPPRCASW